MTFEVFYSVCNDFLMTFVYFCDVSDSSIDFEDYSDVSIDFSDVSIDFEDYSADFKVYSDVSIDFSDVSIDFEDHSAISNDFCILKSIPLYQYTCVMFLIHLLTLKTIPMFIMTFVHLYDVSIGSDVFDLL